MYNLTLTRLSPMAKLTLVVALLFSATLLPNDVFAQDVEFTGIEDGICAIVSMLSGRVAKGLATVAIIFLGIGAFFAKVNWGLAITTAVGIVAIFGAGTIAEQLGVAAGADGIEGQECGNAGGGGGGGDD